MHGQWEIVFVLSDRLNIVKLLLHCIVHTVNSFTLLSTHLQTSYIFKLIIPLTLGYCITSLHGRSHL